MKSAIKMPALEEKYWTGSDIARLQYWESARLRKWNLFGY